MIQQTIKQLSTTKFSLKTETKVYGYLLSVGYQWRIARQWQNEDIIGALDMVSVMSLLQDTRHIKRISTLARQIPKWDS